MSWNTLSHKPFVSGVFLVLLLCGPVFAVYIPELPRAVPDVSMPVQTGSTISVGVGGDLQAALNAAQPGDTIVLAAGAVFTGNYVLPAKTNPLNRWIVVRTSDMASIPPNGTRVNATHAASMPVLRTPNTDPALRAGVGASYWRFVGVAFTQSPATSFTYQLVSAQSESAQSPADAGRYLVFDRVAVYPRTGSEARRGFQLDCSWCAVVDSRISGIRESGSDNQAIAFWQATGPILIDNNFLESGGENVLIGGSQPFSLRMPEDITITRNHLYKPLSWIGQSTQNKNIFEIKFGQRILVEGNVFENNWAEAQGGDAILFSTTSNGNNPWVTINNVTFRNNIVQTIGGGFVISDNNGGGVVPGQGILVENNLILNVSDPVLGGYGRVITNGVSNFTFRRNTAIYHPSSPSRNAIWSVDRIMTGVTYTDNIMDSSDYGVFGSGVGTGTVAMTAYLPGSVFTGNVFVGESAGSYPPGNAFPATLSVVGFSDSARGNWSLSPISPYRNSATDGSAPGVDFAVLLNATRGAVSGVWSDTTPPVASVTAPSAAQVLAAGTTSTTLSVTTDEAATCRWSTLDQSYSGMATTFTTSDGTSHSTTLTGLADGTSYTRFVRCQDTAGNAMTTSVNATFSVAAVAPVRLVDVDFADVSSMGNLTGSGTYHRWSSGFGENGGGALVRDLLVGTSDTGSYTHLQIPPTNHTFSAFRFRWNGSPEGATGSAFKFYRVELPNQGGIFRRAICMHYGVGFDDRAGTGGGGASIGIFGRQAENGWVSQGLPVYAQNIETDGQWHEIEMEIDYDAPGNRVEARLWYRAPNGTITPIVMPAGPAWTNDCPTYRNAVASNQLQWEGGVPGVTPSTLYATRERVGGAEYFAIMGTASSGPLTNSTNLAISRWAISTERIGPLTAPPPAPPVTLRGDVDGNGVVNILDIVIIAADIGKRNGYDPRSDRNNDGVVNVFDFVLVGREWGRTR